MPTKNFYYTGTTVTEAVPAQLQLRRRLRRRRDHACTTAKSARWSSRSRSRRRRRRSTDSICWEANVITFNSSNVFGSKNLANDPDHVPERLGGAELQRLDGHRSAGVTRCSAARRRCSARHRHDDHDGHHDVQRPAGRRLRGAVVQQRHAHGPVALRCCRTTAATSSTRRPVRSSNGRLLKWSGGAGSDSRPVF